MTMTTTIIAAGGAFIVTKSTMHIMNAEKLYLERVIIGVKLAAGFIMPSRMKKSPLEK